jgi:hypothetical protein
LAAEVEAVPDASIGPGADSTTGRRHHRAPITAVATVSASSEASNVATTSTSLGTRSSS